MALKTTTAAALVAGTLPAPGADGPRRYVRILADCLVGGVHCAAGSLHSFAADDPRLRQLLGSTRAREIDAATFDAEASRKD